MTHKVCHLSSVHYAKDVRIFHKECASLAAAGYDVTLIIPDAEDHIEKGVKVAAVAKPANRRERMTKTIMSVYNRALETDAELYHFHDAELFPVGLALKARGKRVIFDSHEDLPRQILSKPWIHPALRKVVAGVGEFIEDNAAKRLDAVIAATPTIGDRFAAQGVTTEVVNNYPILDELSLGPVDWSKKKRQAFYVGGITAIRGAREMVAAIAFTDASLIMGGPVEASLQDDLKRASAHENIDLPGFLDRPTVARHLGESMVGLCVLHPTANYVDATPIKLFEYMASELPVIASDFPRWRELVGDSGAAIFVDPLDPAAIGGAIQHLVDHPDEAEAMGKRGRQRVVDGFNWGVEVKKLFALYERLLAPT
jgi:glycosyltransferase involved in cell wall biosynthesis